MANTDILVDDVASFETEGRLLQELGERLVSSADVALVELIKNAYDADATSCRVVYDGNSIEITDDGHGITQNEFLEKWMRIATGHKQEDSKSRKFERLMTGAKGIGRFAVRLLGGNLNLISIADDEKGFKTKLVATFNWEQIDKSTELRKAQIPYQIFKAETGALNGTILTISKLKNPDKIDFGRTLKTQILSIVSPISGLDRGKFNYVKQNDADPGFKLELPSSSQDEADINLAKVILSHYYARIIIKADDTKVKYIIKHKDGRELIDKTFKYESNLSRGLHADIRYFPRRAGMFAGTEVDGKKAWTWVRDNCGIGIVDHGFRISPYGLEDDDWLSLDTDTAHNRRKWRSKLMNKYYPIPETVEGTTKEKANPMLYLSNFHQLVGAVFVESVQVKGQVLPRDLTPAADREGFLDNEAYNDMVDIIRTGMELLALVDHQENRRIEEAKATEKAKSLKSDFKKAVNYIRSIPSLEEDDKYKIIYNYSNLSTELERVEDYYHQTSQSMQTMALLGVLAGFMTHESKRLIVDIEQVVKHLKQIAKTDNYVNKVLPKISKTLDEFKGQIDYSTMFISSIQDKTIKPKRIPVLSQIVLIQDRFKNFTDDREINVIKDVDEDLLGPAIPIAIYSGILLNLYTNALKAVTTATTIGNKPEIVFKAWNEKKSHLLEVADNGIGIPNEIEKYIWDPLFTTTSGGIANPLGSGMGLGLSLIKEILKRIKGHITLVKPPPGYSTCFKVEFEIKED